MKILGKKTLKHDKINNNILIKVGFIVKLKNTKLSTNINEKIGKKNIKINKNS